ncbi:MAG: purine-binding chemotaxis protein CheW [Spirochaetaceae bacterium]|nr:MAG: purine-binding chemotaxis protein CheW [Spirochaetaceae bacterium]
MNQQKDSGSTDQDQKVVQMINFVVGGDEYAVDIQKVREVINLCEITQLPKAPSFIKGIINLRGEVIPVTDLREKFGLPHAEYTALTNIIIVEIARKAVGVVVDSVSHVIRVGDNAIAPPPPLIGGLAGKYVNGVAKLQDRMIVVLDMEKILSAEEMVELKELAAVISKAENR